MKSLALAALAFSSASSTLLDTIAFGVSRPTEYFTIMQIHAYRSLPGFMHS